MCSVFVTMVTPSFESAVHLMNTSLRPQATCMITHSWFSTLVAHFDKTLQNHVKHSCMDWKGNGKQWLLKKCAFSLNPSFFSFIAGRHITGAKHAPSHSSYFKLKSTSNICHDPFWHLNFSWLTGKYPDLVMQNGGFFFFQWTFSNCNNYAQFQVIQTHYNLHLSHFIVC